MIVFISSVRRGLEEERDTLPGLLLALGHEPRRFEDYTAQPLPSREACLRGVEDADVYLLLLGPHYGEPVFDTRLSPTEEEFVVARRRGIPMLAFRKVRPSPDEKQKEFIERVEEYTGGLFRDSFEDAADLQARVVAGLHQLAEPAEPLIWVPLDYLIDVPWLHIVDRAGAHGSAVLECHVLRANSGPRIPAAALDSLPRRLAVLGRDHGFFGPEEALNLETNPDEARAATVGRYGEPGRGIRVRRDGSITIWAELARDNLGHILDRVDTEERIAASLGLARELIAQEVERVAFAVGLAPISFVVAGSIAELGHRSSASMGMPGQDWVKVEPEDSVPSSALGPAVSEAARELTARLFQRFESIRR